MRPRDESPRDEALRADQAFSAEKWGFFQLETVGFYLSVEF